MKMKRLTIGEQQYQLAKKFKLEKEVADYYKESVNDYIDPILPAYRPGEEVLPFNTLFVFTNRDIIDLDPKSKTREDELSLVHSIADNRVDYMIDKTLNEIKTKLRTIIYFRLNAINHMDRKDFIDSIINQWESKISFSSYYEITNIIDLSGNKDELRNMMYLKVNALIMKLYTSFITNTFRPLVYAGVYTQDEEAAFVEEFTLFRDKLVNTYANIIEERLYLYHTV